MEYNYEALLEQRFQMLCQALLVQEFPGTQCLPVGMPDGGRDATHFDPSTGRSIVFQVKFARNPSQITDPVAWLKKAIDGELSKVERLAHRGANRYVLITNLSTTAHLDTGRLDRVRAYFEERIPIASQCWWRNDLDRRLDSSYDIKLRYPDVMSGLDAVRLVWEAIQVGDEAERRRSAIMAYLSYQHNQDSIIRFKQADLLPSALFDLFIDVPAQPPRWRNERKRRPHDFAYTSAALRAIESRHQAVEGEPSDHDEPSDQDLSLTNYIMWSHDIDGPRPLIRLPNGRLAEVSIGAADLLLDADYSAEIPRLVLEGAPGQGKSTLAQYLAQVNRVRFLQPAPDISKIPKIHSASPLVLPSSLS